MDDLFDYVDELDWGVVANRLDKIASEITAEWELPPRGIIVVRTIGKGEKTRTKGKVISYKICANEPAYPATKEEMDDDKRTQSIFVTIKIPTMKKWQGFAELRLPKFIVSKVIVPNEAIIISTSVDDDDDEEELGFRIMAPINSEATYDFLRGIVTYRLKCYSSAADTFGCCDLFNKCSDARKCLHENRLYSTACSYRHNLEDGRIFYGKNRNV